MPGKKVYLARHGERVDFVDPKWQLTAALPDDPPLTARGEQQALDLGRFLRPLNIATIYTSPFQRCVRTAALASSQLEKPLKVRVEPGACEWLNALWYTNDPRGPVLRSLAELTQGAARVEGATGSGDGDGGDDSIIDMAYEGVRPPAFNFDGFPESQRAFFLRCADVVRTLVNRDDGDGNVLIVGHGTSLGGIFNSLCPSIRMAAITYCSLTECIPKQHNKAGGTGNDAEEDEYEVGLMCEASFLSDAQKTGKVRYV